MHQCWRSKSTPRADSLWESRVRGWDLCTASDVSQELLPWIAPFSLLLPAAAAWAAASPGGIIRLAIPGAGEGGDWTAALLASEQHTHTHRPATAAGVGSWNNEGQEAPDLKPLNFCVALDPILRANPHRERGRGILVQIVVVQGAEKFSSANARRARGRQEFLFACLEWREKRIKAAILCTLSGE